ncbi:hypothetical protein D3C86_2089240 [compost metagenome]
MLALHVVRIILICRRSSCTDFSDAELTVSSLRIGQGLLRYRKLVTDVYLTARVMFSLDEMCFLNERMNLRLRFNYGV